MSDLQPEVLSAEEFKRAVIQAFLDSNEISGELRETQRLKKNLELQIGILVEKIKEVKEKYKEPEQKIPPAQQGQIDAWNQEIEAKRRQISSISEADFAADEAKIAAYTSPQGIGTQIIEAAYQKFIEERAKLPKEEPASFHITKPLTIVLANKLGWKIARNLAAGLDIVDKKNEQPQPRKLSQLSEVPEAAIFSEAMQHFDKADAGDYDSTKVEDMTVTIRKDQFMRKSIDGAVQKLYSSARAGGGISKLIDAGPRKEQIALLQEVITKLNECISNQTLSLELATPILRHALRRLMQDLDPNKMHKPGLFTVIKALNRDLLQSAAIGEPEVDSKRDYVKGNAPDGRNYPNDTQAVQQADAAAFLAAMKPDGVLAALLSEQLKGNPQFVKMQTDAEYISRGEEVPPVVKRSWSCFSVESGDAENSRVGNAAFVPGFSRERTLQLGNTSDRSSDSRDATTIPPSLDDDTCTDITTETGVLRSPSSAKQRPEPL